MYSFYQTQMGQTFFEHTLPQIEHQLKRIADALEEKKKIYETHLLKTK
jgi:hypothetical protein